jgi:hypothetical protein
MYQFAVKANYAGGIQSSARLTNVLPNNMEAQWTVNLTTNSGYPVTGAVVTLTNQNGNPAYIYTQTATAAAVVFPAVWKGTYDITVTLAGHKTVTETGVAIQATGSTDITLEEIIENPINLQIDVQGVNAIFSWNNVSPVENFFDDMESHTDFAIENIGQYILHDGDGRPTYGFGGGTTFPNMGYTGSFIVFNPSQIPALATVPGLQPYSGNKFLACFAAEDVANNDWLILPKRLVVAGTKFEFMARTYMSDWGLERFRVGVSTTGTNPSDFTIISPGAFVSPPTAWTRYSYDLSAYVGQEIHVAINCVSHDAFIFMVDDIFMGVPETKRGMTKAFNGFTVCLNGVEKATGIMGTTFTFENLENGDYTAGVQAIYTSGVSVKETIDFTIVEGTGIVIVNREVFMVFPNPVDEELHIQTNQTITRIELLDLNGRILQAWIGDIRTINVQAIPAGNYVLRIHTENAIVPIRIVKQ